MLIKRSIFIAFLLLAGIANAQPVKKEEALKLARYIEVETGKGNNVPLDQFLDLDKIIDNMKSNALNNEGFRNGFREGFATSMKGYGVKIINNVKGGNYRLLRAYEKNGEQHLVFRMFGNGGLNYHDYSLVREKDSIKASDCFVYLTDESLSTTMSKLVDMINTGNEISPDVESMKQLTTLRNQGDYVGAKSYYDKLDGRMKKTKAIQVVYLSICHKINDSLYQRMLEQYVRLYPNVSSGYMMMLDLYYIQKEGNKGIVAVNKLDSLLNGDPFLNFYRGAFYGLAGKKDQSLACYEKAYRYDPSIVANTRSLIMAYADAKLADKAKLVIAGYKKLPSFQQEDLDAIYASYPNLK